MMRLTPALHAVLLWVTVFCEDVRSRLPGEQGPDEARLRELDLDEDGAVTLEEILQSFDDSFSEEVVTFVTEHFPSMDVEGDGRLAVAELANLHRFYEQRFGDGVGEAYGVIDEEV
eukprot:TRINITY_DN21862_c0_g2_i1.p1 TRINITY_DN21862_c0_g2~~TRINITY_DN21862_c0_g2_i1.p1  ORF type:complete len:116 (+),score=26.96 TRINITY_DN21862_c0_g2_i1:68-415(+)